MGLKVISLPELGEGVTEGEIIKIKVSEGETISMDQVLLEVMTDKASMEVPSFMEGTIQKVEVAEGDIVPVGAKLFTIITKDEDATDDSQSPEQDSPPVKELKSKQPKSPSSAKQQKHFITEETLAIPSTRKLATELNISLDSVKGTGPKGEIKREDLLNHVKIPFKTLFT